MCCVVRGECSVCGVYRYRDRESTSSIPYISIYFTPCFHGTLFLCVVHASKNMCVTICECEKKVQKHIARCEKTADRVQKKY